MGLAQAHEDEVERVEPRLAAEGLVGVEVVAEQRGGGFPEQLEIRLEPSLGGGDLAILLVVPVLGDDELGAQRYRPRDARCYEHRRHRRVAVAHTAVGVVLHGATRAVDRLGFVERNPVERDEPQAVDTPIGVELSAVAQHRVELRERRVECRGRYRIEQPTHMVVGGDALDQEKRLGIADAPLALHQTLADKPGGRLQEEDGEGGSNRVHQLVLRVAAFAAVGEDREGALQRLDPPAEHGAAPGRGRLQKLGDVVERVHEDASPPGRRRSERLICVRRATICWSRRCSESPARTASSSAAGM